LGGELCRTGSLEPPSEPAETGCEAEAAAGELGSGGQPQREAGRGQKAREGTKLSIFSPLGMVPEFLTYICWEVEISK